MGYRNKLNTVVTFFLILCVFANSALAEACFCGQACLKSLKTEEKTKMDVPFHMRCTDPLCKSCDIERGQTLKAVNSATHNLKVRALDTDCVLTTLLEYPPMIHTLKDFDSFHAFGTVPVLPIYLQKLALLY